MPLIGFLPTIAPPAEKPPMPLLSHDQPATPPEQPIAPQLPPLDAAPGASLPPVELTAPAEPDVSSILPSSADTSESVVPPPDTETLTQLEQDVQSPHIEAPTQTPLPPLDQPLVPLTPGQPTIPPMDQPPVTPAPAPPAADGDLNAARDAVMQAVNSSDPQILEPVQALNAQPIDLTPPEPPTGDAQPGAGVQLPTDMPKPFDLNLGETPSVAGVSDTPDATPETPMMDASSVASDPGLPPGLIPNDPGLPADNTAAPAGDAGAPPPVPPPMMPPMPPTPDQGTDPNAQPPLTPPVL